MTPPFRAARDVIRERDIVCPDGLPGVRVKSSTPRTMLGGRSAFSHANLTAAPCAGVTISPSPIAFRPRTKVPTGQPVAVLPSYGVQAMWLTTIATAEA